MMTRDPIERKRFDALNAHLFISKRACVINVYESELTSLNRIICSTAHNDTIVRELYNEYASIV